MKKSELLKIIKEEVFRAVLESSFDSKDSQRIKDMFAKSKGDDSKLLQLASNMAKSITDPLKAWRRGEAAKAAVDEPKFHDIFFNRAKELGYNPGEPNKKSGKPEIFLPTWSAIALWSGEILGQLSDGAWENTSPDDHWIPWSKMEVKKGSPDASYPGRVPKNNYSLTSLLQYIGDRMVAIGKLGKALNKKINSEQSAWAEYAPKTAEQYQEMLADKSKRKGYGMQKYFDSVSQNEAQKFYDTKYEKKDLLTDLKLIKKAMQSVPTYNQY